MTFPVRFALRVLLLAALVAGAGGCARKKPAATPMRIRLAVLDFTPPDDSYYAEDFEYTKREGWWFSSSDLRREEHVGIQAANKIASRLDRMELITVEPRLDIRYYMANKADMLSEQYKDLTPRQIGMLVQKTVKENPVAAGRELQVDRVITGQTLEARLRMNRAFKFWGSAVKARVRMTDVATGEVVFDRTFKKAKWFYSTQRTLEALADDVAEYLTSQYGYY